MTTGTDGAAATGTGPVTEARSRPRRAWLPGPRLRPSIAWGAAVLLLILLAGGAFLATRRDGWTATATAMVVPDQGLDPAAGAGYYETLSRGHVVATVAEIMRLERFGDQAAAEAGVATDQRDSITVDVEVVPNTAVITVAVTAPDAGLAERVADAVVASATTHEGLPEPYDLVSVSGAGNSAHRPDAAGWQFAAVLLLIAIVAAVATQQAAYQLGAAAGARTPPTGPRSERQRAPQARQGLAQDRAADGRGTSP